MTSSQPAIHRRGDDAANVLITAAGRRTTLVRAFAEEAHQRGGRVFAGDVDALAPALFLADVAIQTRATDDPDYVPDLLKSVARHAIALVVPTIDPELPVLAVSQAKFVELGCRVAVSSPSFVRIALDKHETGVTFGEAGIRVPASWLPPVTPHEELPSRLFVKPRKGSASQHAYQVPRARLESVLHLVPDPIVQEVLTGPEITIDALFDFEGTPIHYVPRRRIRTLGGESIQGVTVDHEAALEEWIETVLDLCSTLGAAGPLTLQAFLTPSGPVLAEINARFGGGFPLGLAAGGAYPSWLLDMVAGRRVQSRLREYEPGLFMTRYSVEHFTRHPKW